MPTDYPDYTLPIVVIGTVTVTGAVTVSGTVAVSGTVTVTGAVTVTGSVTVSGTVAVSGTVTVTGAVTVSGTVAISGSVAVTGTVAVSGTVTVTGAVTVSGTVAISGAVTVTGSVTVSGTVAVSGTVTVTGAVTVSGTVAISGSVAVTGTVAISGTVTVAGAVTVSGTVAVSGTVTVTGTVAVSGTVTVSGTVAVSGTVTVTGSVTVSGTVAVSGTVTVTGSVTVSGTVAVSGTVTITGSVTVSNTVTVTGSVTVSGTVAVSGTVTVTGSVTVSGTVSISGSVTVTGAVTISGPVTVTTVAADNIIIDKLTVGAYTERRSTLSNDGVVSAWAASIGANRYSKFFPRGARGFLNTIDVYCKDAGATGGTITVYLAPYIGAGYMYTATIAVPPSGAEAWRSATFNKMWNYDSLFIFVLSSTADMVFAYNAAAPFDFHSSADSGATWGPWVWRLLFRAVYTGETVGDVPVSGTVNNIEIPNTAASRQFKTLAVPAATELMDTIQYGSGKLLIAMFHYYGGTAGLSVLFPRIKCDGVEVLPINNSFSIWKTRYISSSGDIYIGLWDATNNFYTIIVIIKYPFKRSLEVGFFNDDAGTAYTGYVAYSYETIS